MCSHQVMGTQALNQNLSTNNDNRHSSGIISLITLISLLQYSEEVCDWELGGLGDCGNAYDVPT
jgi:hypothetical protein